MKRFPIGLVFPLLLVSLCPSQTARLVKDINQRLTPTPSNPRPGAASTQHDHSQFVTVLDTTYFVATHKTFGTELFETKGTKATTKLAMDIQPGFMSSNPDGLMTDGYRLFFSAFDGLHGRELWVAEPLFGTVRRVADINPALTEGSNPAHMTQLNGMILFQASSYGKDLELWLRPGHDAGQDVLDEHRVLRGSIRPPQFCTSRAGPPGRGSSCGSSMSNREIRDSYTMCSPDPEGAEWTISSSIATSCTSSRRAYIGFPTR